jgi:hypothetical protein
MQTVLKDGRNTILDGRLFTMLCQKKGCKNMVTHFFFVLTNEKALN